MNMMIEGCIEMLLLLGVTCTFQVVSGKTAIYRFSVRRKWTSSLEGRAQFHPKILAQLLIIEPEDNDGFASYLPDLFCSRYRSRRKRMLREVIGVLLVLVMIGILPAGTAPAISVHPNGIGTQDPIQFQ